MAWLDLERQTCQSEVLPLRSVVVKRPRDAFGDCARIERQWRGLGYAAAPDLDAATREHEALVDILTAGGAEVHSLPADRATGLDSIYPRDASIVTDRGVILCNMGKAERASEPAAHARFYARLGVPILGRIQPPGTLEGGDVAWLDRATLGVARSYRTNDAGLRQLAALVGREIEVLRMEAPHGRGPTDVFHLMSVLSPVAERTLLVFSPLMSIPLRERLLEREFRLVEVPEEEFATLGGNVLATAPGAVIVPAGNRRTRARLERAGVETIELEGCEICCKGAGGPTCLTRPLARELVA